MPVSWTSWTAYARCIWPWAVLWVSCNRNRGSSLWHATRRQAHHGTGWATATAARGSPRSNAVPALFQWPSGSPKNSPKKCSTFVLALFYCRQRAEKGIRRPWHPSPQCRSIFCTERSRGAIHKTGQNQNSKWTVSFHAQTLPRWWDFHLATTVDRNEIQSEFEVLNCHVSVVCSPADLF